MKPDYFFIDEFEWKVDPRKNARHSSLQDVFELPSAIVQLDKKVKSWLCELLASEKTASLHDALERSRKELDADRAMGWGLSFRATYLFAWSHDLAWFAMAPSSGATLVTIRKPFKSCCHVCEGGGYGYKGPGEGFGRKWDGDLLKEPPIPAGLQKSVDEIKQEISLLRSSGVFDPIMKDITRAMKKLGRSPNAYIILPIFDFSVEGKTVAMCAGKWLSPGALAGVYPTRYYSPCSWCRGSGVEY